MPTSNAGVFGSAPAPSRLARVLRTLRRTAWVVPVTLACSVFAAEGAFRLLGTRVAATMEGFYEPFGDGSFKHKPGASAFMNWSSGPFHVQIDALGMRTDHTDPVAASHADRNPDILVLGNSCAFGQGLDDAEAPIGAFAGYATKLGLRVANTAVIGHFPKNQEELLTWLVRDQGVRPRLVLVTPTPHYLGYVDHYFKSHVHNSALFAGPPGKKELIKKWLLAHSAVYVTLRDAFKQGDDKEANDVTFMLFDPAHAATREAQFAESLRRLQALLQPIGNEVVGGGVKLAVAYFPLAVEQEIPELARAMKYAGQVDSHVPRDIARNAARSVGVPFIDLAPAIDECLAAGEPLTLRGDPHYGPELSARLARRLWEGLDWRALIPSSPATSAAPPAPAR